MRTLSTAETTLHQSANRSVHVRVRIDRSSPVTNGFNYTGNFSSDAKTLSGSGTGSVQNPPSLKKLTATDSKFTQELSVGSEITVGSESRIVESITSDTVLDVTENMTAGTSLAITQNPGSNIIDFSDYKGYNWIKDVSIDTTLDEPVSSASITLIRQIEELSLSPLVLSSLPNLQHGVSSPALDITNKLVIETATLPMDVEVQNSDFEEVFRGYIDEVDWGAEEISIRCRDLGGKYQDWQIIHGIRDSTNGLTFEGYGNSPTADTPTNLTIYDIMQTILSSQNEAYHGGSGAHSASEAVYRHNNVDYYLFTETGNDSNLLVSNKVSAKSTSGTIRVLANSISVAGSGTKFTSQCAVGMGISFTLDDGETHDSIIDEISSDTVMKLQDAVPSGADNKAFTIDERPQYVPSKIFDVTDSNLMEAVRSVAQSIGYDFRFKFNDNVDGTTVSEGVDATAKGGFVPTVFCPLRDRISTNVDFTFGPSAYYDISSLSTSTARIRNHVRVHYTEYATTGSDGEPVANNLKFMEVENAASIAKYGRRSMILGGTEDALGLITTSIEAERLARLALKDLVDPEIIKTVELPYFFAAEVGDFYEFSANDDHYSSDQHLAVHSISHSFDGTEATTTLECRGKPSGGLNSHLRGGQQTSSYHGVAAPVLSVSSDAGQAAVSNYSASGNYSVTSDGTGTTVVASNATSKANMLTQIFVGRKVTLSYNSGSIERTVTSVVKNSDYIVDTTSQTELMYFTVDTAIPTTSGATHTASVTVQGGRGIVHGAGTTATLLCTDPDVETHTNGLNVQFLGTNFFMANASGDLVEAACQEDSTPYINGGTYIGEGRRTFTVTGLVPGQTYFFAAKYKLLISNISPETGNCRYTQDDSLLSNVVTFVAPGNNAIHIDRNYSDMVQYNPWGDIGSWFENVTQVGSATPGTNHRAPGGFNVTSGTWGTDFQRNIDTAYIQSGVASIKCPQGASSSAVIETELFTVPGGTLVRAASNVIATRNNLNNMPIFKVELIEYEIDGSTGGTTTILQADGANCPDDHSTESDVWHELSKVIKLQTATRWAKFKISRTTNGNGQFHINDCTVKPTKEAFRQRQGTARTLAKDGVGNLLLIETEEFARFGSISTGGSSSSTNYSFFTAHEDGLYEFTGRFTFTLPGAAPSSVQTILLKNPTVTNATTFSGGTTLVNKIGLADKAAISSTANYQTHFSSGPVELQKGDKVYVNVLSTEQLTCVTTQGLSYFVGRRID